MKVINGWHCPDLLSGPGKYMRRAVEDAPLAFERCKQRRVAVQAGGHVGTWPIFLSKHFERVYTFEPIGENFRCLVRNVSEHAENPDAIFPARGALGHIAKPVDMVISGKSTGQHRARYPSEHKVGTVPVYRLDDLGLPAVDAIFLDLEGFENFALRGALETMKAHRPIVMVENNRRCEDHGFKRGDLEVFMRCANYQIAARVGEDLIFEPRGRG